MFIDFTEKRRGTKEREREISMWERNIYRLALICTLARDRTLNLGVCPDRESNLQPFLLYETTLQAAEPPGQGKAYIV